MGPSSLCNGIGALEMNSNNLLPLVVSKILEALVTQDTSVVNNGMDGTKLL